MGLGTFGFTILVQDFVLRKSWARRTSKDLTLYSQTMEPAQNDKSVAHVAVYIPLGAHNPT